MNAYALGEKKIKLAHKTVADTRKTVQPGVLKKI